jgi:hypothetical protein
MGGALSRQSRQSSGSVMTYSFTLSVGTLLPHDVLTIVISIAGGRRTRGTRRFSGSLFELALGAYFRCQDPGDVLFREWSASENQELQFAKRDSWDQMIEHGITLLMGFLSGRPQLLCLRQRQFSSSSFRAALPHRLRHQDLRRLGPYVRHSYLHPSLQTASEYSHGECALFR